MESCCAFGYAVLVASLRPGSDKSACATSDHTKPLREDPEAEGVRHVLKERVVGVLLIGAGSLLNGYGPALASALSLRGG